MSEIDPLELPADAGQFLDQLDDYLRASAGHMILLAESTRRQFLTAQAILNRLSGRGGEGTRRGVLLADDVGLGKTTVAALVAWVFAGSGLSVRVLAPNEVMRRRWKAELKSHVPMLKQCAPGMSVSEKRVSDEVKRLRAGSIQVATHHYAVKEGTLSCDLLIIDEAHRAKGKDSSFSQALTAQSRRAARVLILTATPMSIHPDDLQRMMELVGAVDTKRPLRAYANALNSFYERSPSASTEQTAERLAERAEAAVTALTPYVIRHGVGDLPRELANFGKIESWNLRVPSANDRELELILRMDRAMRVVRHEREEVRAQTNDARYHVGWDYLHREAAELQRWLRDAPRGTEQVTRKQLAAMQGLEQELGEHPKVAAVADAVRAKVSEGEKVLLFCFHHATAQELTQAVRERLSRPDDTHQRASRSDWYAAWDKVLPQEAALDSPPSDYATLRTTFIEWLCTAGIRRQIESWIDPGRVLSRSEVLVRCISETSARRHGPTIVDAAGDLFTQLLGSKSTLGVLRAAKRARLDLIPGADGVRVLAVCNAPDDDEDQSGFSHANQPDMAIEIFKSPFGPEVLVATDKMSEGIDLHRYCRHLIHYELSASPIRTIQRNGRLLRVNSWAARTGLPIRIAYPAYGGTRDERMVSITKRRIDAFSMLLGGVPTFDEETTEADERWRAEVVQLMRKKLSHLNGRLTVVRS